MFISVIMSSDGVVQTRHTLIARPAGLPGYAPREWCAVCGKTTANLDIQKCIGVSCSNTCHNSCLDGNQNFNCSEVANLRTVLSIPDRVLYINTATEDISSDNTDEDEDLFKLGNRELVTIIRRLQAEITRKNSILKFFDSISNNIASKRDAIVTVLEFIDNIAATKSSLEELEVTSVACSACPDKIDEDWSAAIAADQQLNTWWNSGKPRNLKKVCHLEKSDILLNSDQQQ